MRSGIRSQLSLSPPASLCTSLPASWGRASTRSTAHTVTCSQTPSIARERHWTPMRSRPPCLGCEPEMRVWLSKTEARELRDWAIRQGDSSLADRLHRLAQSNGSEPPPDWRRREDHPLLVRCSYCEQWESYAEHRWAKQDFVHFEGAWVHHACLDGWKENRVEIERRRTRRGQGRTFSTSSSRTRSYLLLKKGSSSGHLSQRKIRGCRS